MGSQTPSDKPCLNRPPQFYVLVTRDEAEETCRCGCSTYGGHDSEMILLAFFTWEEVEKLKALVKGVNGRMSDWEAPYGYTIFYGVYVGTEDGLEIGWLKSGSDWLMSKGWHKFKWETEDAR